MNRTLKIILVSIGAVITATAIFLGVIVIAFSVSGDHAIELSPEEEAAWEEEEKSKYAAIDLDGFATTTLNGERVTSDIFADNKLTMVNLWTTDCSSCIAGMPELEKLYQNRPEGFGIISICVDAVDGERELKLAKKIVKNEGLSFETLLPDDTLKSALTDRTTAFPTTVFVDSKGKNVGDVYLGSEEYDYLLEEAKARLKMTE